MTQPALAARDVANDNPRRRGLRTADGAAHPASRRDGKRVWRGKYSSDPEAIAPIGPQARSQSGAGHLRDRPFVGVVLSRRTV